jgi:predicted flap endonuclease-1-like 5' DNA nuclease
MFDLRQRVYLQVAAAAVIVFFIALIGGADALAALVWGAIVGLALYLVLRQNLVVEGRARVFPGAFLFTPEPDAAPATGVATARAPAARPAAAPVTEAPPPAEAASPTETKAEDVPAAGPAEGSRPAVLDKPRGGQPDDLKRISGIGPKLEKMLNEMGIYHLDQIAGWGADEVDWVDQAITGFRGRASRDKWVEQARNLSK